MKTNKFKSNNLIWIITIIVIIGLSMFSCDFEKNNDDGINKGDTVSGQFTVIGQRIEFIYWSIGDNVSRTCVITTDLPSPNDQISITVQSGFLNNFMVIGDLENGLVINYTATIENGKLELDTLQSFSQIILSGSPY